MGKLAVIIAFSLYILKLAAEGDLTVYIHPRYVAFTVTMALVSLAISLSILIMNRRKHFALRLTRPSILTALCLVVLVLAFVLPPRPLMSSAVEQKSNNARVGGLSSGKLVTSSSAGTCREEAAGIELPLTTIDGWLTAFYACDVDGGFNGHRITLEGFVYDPRGQLVSDNIFQLSRFFVSCCAVDASPIGLYVDEPNWRDEHPADSWVRVEGALEMRQFGADKKMYVIKDAHITPIPEPDDPYEYMR